uniref:Uncharacterized protein n=1 Tax=viral metagenome TaxID=1070528 RepID=A0A6C0EA15_9ZZZZ
MNRFYVYISKITKCEITYDVLKTELISENKSYYHMKLYECDDIFLLKIDKISKNLHSLIESVDVIIHNIDYVVILKNTLEVICYREIPIFLENNDYILNNWEKLDIYTNYIGAYVSVIGYNNKKYCVTTCRTTPLSLLETNKCLFNIFKDVPIEENSYADFIIISGKLKKMVSSVYPDRTVVEIKKNDKIVCKKVNFSCPDELFFELEEIEIIDSINKRLSIAGYVFHNRETDEILFTETKIYRNINSKLPLFDNCDISYIELYKNDKLTEIVTYMSFYPSEIIKRINLSLKTIAKELLNLYHMTRNKENKELYGILPQSYKHMIYMIHKIFIEARNKETVIPMDEFDEKKTISFEDIYLFVKKSNIDNILDIYRDRNDLINKAMDFKDKKIFHTDCIHTTTQIKLMF